MASQSDLTQRLLSDLEKKNSINSLEYSQSIGEEHQRIVGAIKSLETLGNVIAVTSDSAKCWSCTEEGLLISKNGSHEARLFAWLPPSGASVDTIKKEFSTANVALGAALKNKWVRKDGPTVVRAVESISDAVQEDLQAVAAGDQSKLTAKQLADYKKRKLIKDNDVTVFTITKGPDFTTTISKQEAELTKEMIESGVWKTKNFKSFNFRAKGKQETRPGHLHPLMQLRSEFRQIFLEMGFTEMPTNSFVESAFWNFDALFQPQQHPARDAHDTFYVKTPGRALSVPSDYMQRVQKVHSEGGYGSSGYRYPWSEEEAHKNLLRTHTTAVSARMLHRLAQEGFRPAKYFSIDRVFRNETLDATHLAEFHQIEGVVADYNLSVKHLIGMFTAFFEKIGIKNLRFKATYNPYTEPSMEIYSYHDGLQKWVEVGNSGLFRPEMLQPMGLPPNVSVLGWGLSLERPAMIMFGSNNIRELVGPRVKMELVYNNPICTVDKFQTSNLRPPVTPTVASSCDPLSQLSRRQDRILQQLSALQARVRHVAQKMDVPLVDEATSSQTKASSDTHDVLGGLTGAPTANTPIEVVITAHPHRPPHSLPSLLALLCLVTPTAVHAHTHSSVGDLPATLKNFLRCTSSCPDPVVRVRLIWSADLVPKSPSFGPKIPSPRLVVSPHNCTEIVGENNICRYLARLIEVLTKGAPWGQLRAPLYEALPLYLVSECDAWLDDCQAWLITGSSRGRANFLNKLSNKLGESEESSCWLISHQPTLADLFVAANLACLGRTARVAVNVAAWRDRSLSYWLTASKS